MSAEDSDTGLNAVADGAASIAGTLAVAMQQLLANKTLRNGCIAAGKKRAAEFRWETTAQKTLAVYQSLL